MGAVVTGITIGVEGQRRSTALGSCEVGNVVVRERGYHKFRDRLLGFLREVVASFEETEVGAAKTGIGSYARSRTNQVGGDSHFLGVQRTRRVLRHVVVHRRVEGIRSVVLQLQHRLAGVLLAEVVIIGHIGN